MCFSRPDHQPLQRLYLAPIMVESCLPTSVLVHSPYIAHALSLWRELQSGSLHPLPSYPAWDLLAHMLTSLAQGTLFLSLLIGGLAG